MHWTWRWPNQRRAAGGAAEAPVFDVRPRRTPALPRGWNQCVAMVAPLSLHHSTTALATLSASVCVHVGFSRVSTGRPCALR